MMGAKRWFSKTEQHNNKCLKCLRHKKGKGRAHMAQVTWQWEGWGHHQLHGVPYTPKVHSWQHKFSPEVNLCSSPIHLQRMISATPLVKPCPSTPSPTPWMKEVSPDLKLQDVQCSFWTRHFRKSLQSYWGVSQLPTTSNSNWAPCRADKLWGKWDLDSNDHKRYRSLPIPQAVMW